MDSAPALHPDTFGVPPDVYHRRWVILGVLCTSLVTVVVGVSSLNVAIPTLADPIKGLGASATDLQWIIDSYALVFAGLLLPAGALGDRYGRKGALQFGLVVFGLAALAASQVDSPNQLIAARSTMGVGAAFIMPATLSIILTSFPLHERGKAIAVWAGFAGLGGAIGPLSSGILLEHFWWGSIFFVNLPLVLGLLVVAGILVPSSKDPAGHALDPIGAVLSVIALVALIFSIIEGPEAGWTSPVVMGSALLALAAGFAFIRFELVRDNPMLDPRLFRIRGFRWGTVSVTATFFSMFGMFFLLTQYLQFVQGYTPLEAGLRQLPSAAMLLIISPQSPRFVARFGVRRVVRTGFAMSAVGFALFATLRPESPYGVVFVALVLLGAGIALVMPPASQLIVGSVPLAKAGVGSAVNDVTREVGGALGIAVLGSILASGYRRGLDDLTGVPEPAAEVARQGVAAGLGVARTLPGELGGRLADDVIHAFTNGTSWAFAVSAVLATIAAVAIGSRIPDELPGGHGPPPVASGDDISASTSTSPATPA